MWRDMGKSYPQLEYSDSDSSQKVSFCFWSKMVVLLCGGSFRRWNDGGDGGGSGGGGGGDRDLSGGGGDGW